ncbi:ead/Ea22-like family protein [Citrobacter farmeri]|uniref:ead/Ea22-like family protein n=1 Tax=Citrobacter farmeri TaxID=67824 RepID=UPI003B00AC96
MTNKQTLRDIAEQTKIAGEAPVMPFEQRINALNEFMKHFTPATVLALLDELEAAEHTAAVDHEAACSLVEENEVLKRRIAELEALTINPPEVRITVAESKRKNMTWRELGAYNEGADVAKEKILKVIRAAGIGKGE